MKIVTIHQPEHLSYLGFFHKVSLADELVLLDNVNYEKNYFQNRNRIYTNNGEEYITVPVKNAVCKINEVEIANEWEVVRRKNVKKIEMAYKNTPYWCKYGEDFLEAYTVKTNSLALLNYELLQFILKVLKLERKITFASTLGVEGSKTDLLVDILTKVKADKYISGTSGKDYLELEKFGNIQVEFQEFKHPVYTQYGKTEFLPYMSVIDAIFNVGENITEIINRANGKRK